MSSWRVGGPVRSGTWSFVKVGVGKIPFDVISMQICVPFVAL